MIDWTRISELRDEIGADDFTEVVELFLIEVEDEIEKLQASDTPESIESELHFLKGSALNLGFKTFSELCQAGETAASQNHMDTIDIGQIIQCYEASKSMFLSGLDTQLSA